MVKNCIKIVTPTHLRNEALIQLSRHFLYQKHV